MKKGIYSTLAALFIVAQTLPAFAAPVVFTVSATIPSSSGITMTATSISATNPLNRSTVGSSNQLSFDPMELNPALNIFLPDHYFSIDIGATGGGLDVVMTYAEPSSPNGSGHGLGWKSSATFKKVVGSTETNISGHGDAVNGKKLLKDISGEHFTSAQTTGGYLRTYIGINTGDATTPATGEVFSAADKSGAYAGTLTITATVV